LNPAVPISALPSLQQTYDRQRRSLEYCIYQRELHDVSDALETIEEERRRDVDSANSRREEFQGREKEMNEIARKIEQHRERLEDLRGEHREGSGERREVVKARTQVECLVRDAEEAGSASIAPFRLSLSSTRRSADCNR
jgi:structural maintenance of chromosome 3 (chondroitin sulfate proteoglycan 6)